MSNPEEAKEETNEFEENMKEVINEMIGIINKNMPFMNQFFVAIVDSVDSADNKHEIERYVDATIEISKTTKDPEELKRILMANANNFQQLTMLTYIAVLADYSEALRKDVEDQKTKSKIITFPNGLGLNTDTIN